MSPTLGELVESVGRMVIRLISTLQDKDILSEEEIDEIMEPIEEYREELDD